MQYMSLYLIKLINSKSSEYKKKISFSEMNDATLHGNSPQVRRPPGRRRSRYRRSAQMPPQSTSPGIGNQGRGEVRTEQ